MPSWVPCPARKTERGAREHKSGALGDPPVPVFGVIHTWKREKRMSDDFET